MKNRIIGYLIIGLFLLGLAFQHTQWNWLQAYEDKVWVSTVFLKYGRLRYNAASPIHIIAGYDIENCVVEAPPQNNVLYLLNIRVDAPNSPPALSIGVPEVRISE